MRTDAATLVLLLATPAAAVEVSSTETVYDLAGVWLFHEGDNPAFAKPQLDDRAWEERILPTRASSQEGWEGRAWYRLHINVERQVLGETFAVAVGPAREAVEIYVNGSLVARRGTFGSRARGGPRVMILSGLLQPGLFVAGDNVIALRVLDPTRSGGIPTGPLLLGPNDLVAERVEPPSQLAVSSRVSLGLLALCLGLAQVLTVFGRRASRENWWLVGAGVSGSIMLFGGTGVLAGVVPNLELVTRMPVVGAALTILCLSSYFASRFDDWGARHVKIGRILLLVLAGSLLLLWEHYVFVAGDALLLVAALVTTLYAANQLSKAARRQEQGAVPVFVSLLVMVPLLVYDGIWSSAASVLPPMSTVGLVGVLLTTGVVGARTTMQEHERVLAEMLRLRKLGEGSSWRGILDTTAMSITHPREFINAVVHEAARELEVRRCSLVLEDDDAVVRVAAGVGLPTAALSQVVDRVGSIAGWVFEHGDAVTSNSLPDGLGDKRRGRGYQSASFISYPVKHGGRMLGVLNVSDRHDGAELGTSEEIETGEVADKLALVLTRLGERATTWVDAADPGSESGTQLGPTFDEALAAAEEAVVRATGRHEAVLVPEEWSDEDLEQFADEVVESTRSGEIRVPPDIDEPPAEDGISDTGGSAADASSGVEGEKHGASSVDARAEGEEHGASSVDARADDEERGAFPVDARAEGGESGAYSVDAGAEGGESGAFSVDAGAEGGERGAFSFDVRADDEERGASSVDARVEADESGAILVDARTGDEETGMRPVDLRAASTKDPTDPAPDQAAEPEDEPESGPTPGH